MPRHRRRHPYNPLAPIPPKRLNKLARAYVRAQYGPLLSEINAEYARRSESGRNAIDASTAALARELSGQAAQTHNIYAGAQAQQQGIDSGLASFLRGSGQELAQQIGAQPGLDKGTGGGLAQTGAGAGAASLGMGSAALSRLVAEGAARENYSAGLPNIARLGGHQRQRDVELQLEAAREKDAAGLRAKIPGLVAQIEQDMANREFQKAAANLSYTGDIQQAQLGYQAKSQSNKQRAKSTRESARHHRQQEAASRRSQAERERKDRIAARQHARQQWYREHQANKSKKHKKKHKRSGGGGGYTPPGG